MATNERMWDTISPVKQQVDESGHFVDRRVLTWDSASQSRTVFLSQYPDLCCVNTRHIISNGRVWGWREEETEKERKRRRRTHQETHRERRTVSLLINWKRTSTPPSPVQTYGVIRTTLLRCHPPIFSSLLSSPLTPTRKPFNQPPGEYIDMIWDKKEGKTEGGIGDRMSGVH